MPDLLALLLMLAALAPLPAEARDSKQVKVFRSLHPCPATGRTTGACPGYVVDHAYPLCAGGKDEPANLMWQDVKQSYVKDRLERELCACKAKHA